MTLKTHVRTGYERIELITYLNGNYHMNGHNGWSTG